MMKHNDSEQEKLNFQQITPTRYHWLVDCGFTHAELHQAYGKITAWDGASVWKELSYLCTTMQENSSGFSLEQYIKNKGRNTYNPLPTERAYYLLRVKKTKVMESLLLLRTMLQQCVLPIQASQQLVYWEQSLPRNIWLKYQSLTTLLYGLIPIEPDLKVRWDYVKLFLLLHRLPT